MTEAIENPKIRDFVHSPIDRSFDLTIQTIAENCRTYGRFSAWLNEDVNEIVNVLEVVEQSGVSPAFFASYEATEGYNSQWGWLNHTSQDGNYVEDAQSVCAWIVEQSANTTDDPAWIDYANYNDFVPEDVKQAGNQDFQNMTSGSIGKVIIAGTAAATWEVYYPKGLLEEYNGVQDYGAPIEGMVNYIESWGGTVESGSDPDPEDPDFDQLIQDVLTIVQNGHTNINQDIDGLDLSGFDVDGLFNQYLDKKSDKLYSNTTLKAQIIYNLIKIKPTSNVDINFNNLVDSIKQVIQDQFDNMVNQINQLETGGNGGNGGTSSKVFPVDFSQNGVNFWKKDNYALGDIQYEMGYGYTRNGGDRFHAGIDIGASGVTGLGVYAVTSGTITYAQYSDSLGYFMQIEHDDDNYYSTYGHLVNESNRFNVGDQVQAGDQIGVMGDTPGNVAIHLHFVLSDDGSTNGVDSTFDPEKYLEITGDNTTNLPNPNN